MKAPTQFAQRVYDAVCTIPKGKVTTYKAIAEKLGTGAYRGVGQALGSNPFAPQVPCHRVIASNGTIGGFAHTKQGPEIDRKIALLRKEGVIIQDGKIPESCILRSL